MAARLTSVAIRIGLTDSYYRNVLDDSPIGFWLLNELQSGTGHVRDFSGNSRTGTAGANTTFGHYGPFPHGGTAYRMDGTSSGIVNLGDVAAFEFSAHAFTIAAMVQPNSGAVRQIFSKYGAGAGGYYVQMDADGKIRFIGKNGADATIWDVVTDAGEVVDDGDWHHVVVTWDGTTAANGVEIWLDGVVAKQGQATGTTLGGTAANVQIGGTGSEFSGQICGVALWDSELAGARIAVHYAATLYTDVTADSFGGQGLHLEYGINGTKPLDRLANAGTCDFALNNSRTNSAGLRGYYSPLHVDCRAGFQHNRPVQVQVTYGGTTSTKFWGRLIVIDPEPGQFLDQRTHCLAHDYAYLLADSDVREISPQSNVDDSNAIRTVIEALGPEEQPMAFTLDTELDTYTYVFNDIQGGVKAAAALLRVIVSGWSRMIIEGDGTVAWTNREAQTNQAVSGVFDNDMEAVEVPSDQTDVFDVVRTITHPKAVDTGANTVLYSHPADSTKKPFVPANGGTLTIDGIFRNPNNDLQTVGGANMAAPVSGTDFIANSAEDGSGSNLTASVTDVATYYQTFGRFLLTNNHATLGAYFTTLQAQGDGIYDKAPVVSEAGTGTRPITIDLFYQHDSTVGQEIADYILNERESITDPIESFSINPQRNTTFMTFTVNAEPGQLVTITESQTGLDEAQAILRKVELDIGPKLWMHATFGLTPVVVGFEWILDDTNFSVLGETTVWAAG